MKRITYKWVVRVALYRPCHQEHLLLLSDILHPPLLQLTWNCVSPWIQITTMGVHYIFTRWDCAIEPCVHLFMMAQFQQPLWHACLLDRNHATRQQIQGESARVDLIRYFKPQSSYHLPAFTLPTWCTRYTCGTLCEMRKNFCLLQKKL